jgi:TonB family protein
VPKEDEDGVPVMFGDMLDAAGDSDGPMLAANKAKEVPKPETPKADEPKPNPVKTPEPVQEPLVTQKSEPSIDVLAEKRKAEEEERRRQAEEARKAEERKRQEEERKKREARERADSKMGAFGNTKSNGNNGQTTGTGLQGSAEGNSNNGNVTGVGGAGDNPVAKVGSRNPLYIPKPAYVDTSGSGTVVVQIIVNKSGKVIDARIKSNTASEALANEALKKARMSTFSAGESDAEVGTITYRFRLT